MWTLITPGFFRKLRRAQKCPALWATGTTGTPACIAMWNGPFLTGPIRGVDDRVPSGATTNETEEIGGALHGGD